MKEMDDSDILRDSETWFTSSTHGSLGTFVLNVLQQIIELPLSGFVCVQNRVALFPVKHFAIYSTPLSDNQVCLGNADPPLGFTITGTLRA